MIDRILSRLRGRDLLEIIGLVLKNGRHALHGLNSAERARRHADTAFDRRWGTDTSRGVSVHDLGISGPRVAHCRRYDPSSEAMLYRPVTALGIDPARFDFIDYGAGKGRPMMLAALMGFRSVTGVELSTKLCEIARANLDRFAAQNPNTPRGLVIGADATQVLPKGRHILAYLYNPFDATILRTVRERLEDAVHGGAETLHIVYANPDHVGVFEGDDRWTVTHLAAGLATVTADIARIRGLRRAA